MDLTILEEEFVKIMHMHSVFLHTPVDVEKIF